MKKQGIKKSIFVIITAFMITLASLCLTVNAAQEKVIDKYSIKAKIYSSKCSCNILYNYGIDGGSSYISPDCGFAWTGKEVCPKIELRDGSTLLKENVDYKVTYANNVNIGPAKLIVTGIGNWTGRVEYDFDVIPVTFGEGNRISFTLSKKCFKADGTKKHPKVVSIIDNWRNYKLKEGVDYIVTGYSDDIYPGTGCVYILGKGNYSGMSSGIINYHGHRIHYTCSLQYTIEGKTCTVKGQKYTVTLLPKKGNKGEVAFKKAKNSRKVIVPSTIKLKDGKSYKVTSIKPKAFKGKSIRTVTIGKNVNLIKSKAFNGSNATKIILKSKKLRWEDSVKGSLKGSKVKTVQVKVGWKADNEDYVEMYKKVFTKINAGKKVKVKS